MYIQSISLAMIWYTEYLRIWIAWSKNVSLTHPQIFHTTVNSYSLITMRIIYHTNSLTKPLYTYWSEKERVSGMLSQLTKLIQLLKQQGADLHLIFKFPLYVELFCLPFTQQKISFCTTSHIMTIITVIYVTQCRQKNSVQFKNSQHKKRMSQKSSNLKHTC